MTGIPCEREIRKLYKHTSTLLEILRKLPKVVDVVKPNDSPEYFWLLEKTLFAYDNDEILKTNYDDYIYPYRPNADDSLETLLVNVVSRMRKFNSRNVLLTSIDILPNGNEFPAALNAQLPQWELLLRRIGPAHLCRLLVDGNLFVGLRNHPGSFLQICGTSFSDLWWRENKASWVSRKSRQKTSRHLTKDCNIHQCEKKSADELKKVKSAVISKQRVLEQDPLLDPSGCAIYSFHPLSKIYRSLEQSNVDELIYLMLIHTLDDNADSFRRSKEETREHEKQARAWIDKQEFLPRLKEVAKKISYRHQKLPYSVIFSQLCSPHTQDQTKNNDTLFDVSSKKKRKNTEESDAHLKKKRRKSEKHERSQRKKRKLDQNKRKKTPKGQPVRSTGDGHLLHFQVIRFCQTIIKKLLPPELLGSKENWDIVMNSIRRYVQLRKDDKLSLHAMTEGISVSSIQWLTNGATKLPRPRLLKLQQILHRLLYWIFNHLLVKVITSFFYVIQPQKTDTVFYYPHDVWKSKNDIAIAELVATKLRPTDRHVDSQSFGPERPRPPNLHRPITNLGWSTVRIVPKPSLHAVRIIMQLGVGRRGPGLKPMKSVNDRLGDIFSVLSYEKEHNPFIFESGEMTSASGFPKLLTEFRKKHPPNQKFYIVKLDISQAFDNIPPHKAYEMAKSLLSSSSCYTVKKQNAFTFQRTGSFPSLVESISDATCSSLPRLSRKLKNSILVGKNQGRVTKSIEKFDILQLLYEHVNNNLIQIGKKHYRQVIGIPQGSKLAPLLCNLVYGALEADFFHRYPSYSGKLFRYIDDFFFISPHRREATTFFNDMVNGVYHDYGARVSKEKTVINFDPSETTGPFTKSNTIEYLGWSFNSNTLRFNVPEPLDRNEIRNATTIKQLAPTGLQWIQQNLLQFGYTRVTNSLFDASIHGKNKVLKSIDHLGVELGNMLICCVKRASRVEYPRPLLKCIRKTCQKLGLFIYHRQAAKRNSCDFLKFRTITMILEDKMIVQLSTSSLMDATVKHWYKMEIQMPVRRPYRHTGQQHSLK
uniref:Telomerase reverse transcriptase n=1 Tax=Blastobotrys adeninivorans TaxID=409370 RepID=A0A060T762_BLAAD